ncbi:unnamed protein product [Amoebophrya sp. A120]|nr:unnamed protein product [Amoebophrya sp. A120]|eukprot:GSA120T00015558001.1
MAATSASDSGTSSTSKIGRCYIFILVITGFAISVGLVNVTKWLYVEHHFRYPVWLTGTHMLMSYVAASVGLFVFEIVPRETRPILTMRQQLFLITPFSCAGALSLGAANMALVYLYPSFHAMLQNSTPLWTVLSAMVFQGKRFNRSAYLALIPVCGGGAICAFNEGSQFAVFGLLISLSAALFRAVKAVLQAELLRGADLKLDSISLLYYSSPVNMLLFFIWSFFQENQLEPYYEFYFALTSMGKFWVCLGAFMAAMFNLIGFLTIGYLGAVVAMVVGNMKTPTTILVSAIVFNNPVHWKQIVGFLVGAFGVLFYDRYGREESSKIPTPSNAIGRVLSSPGSSSRKIKSPVTKRSLNLQEKYLSKFGFESVPNREVLDDEEFGLQDEDEENYNLDSALDEEEDAGINSGSKVNLELAHMDAFGGSSGGGRHDAPGGTVVFGAGGHKEAVRIDVNDTGPGGEKKQGRGSTRINAGGVGAALPAMLGKSQQIGIGVVGGGTARDGGL